MGQRFISNLAFIRACAVSTCSCNRMKQIQFFFASDALTSVSFPVSLNVHIILIITAPPLCADITY